MTDFLDKTQKWHNSARGRVVLALFGLAFAAGGFLPSHSAKAAVTYYQGNASAENNSNPRAVGLPSRAIAGDLIVVGCAADTTNALSITDTLGNTYTPIGSAIVQSGYKGQLFYASNVKGGYDGVICSFGGVGGSSTFIAVHEYAGADPNNPLDTYAYGKGNGTTLDSGATTTKWSSDVLFAFGFTIDNINAVDSNYVRRHAMYGDATADRIATSAGSYKVTMTSANPNNWLMLMAAFRAAPNGTQMTSRSDGLSDSRMSATSNHSLSFTANSAVKGGDNLALNYGAAFRPTTLDCRDIDAATSSQFNFNYPACVETATAWGFDVRPNAFAVQLERIGGDSTVPRSLTFSSPNTAGNTIIVAAQYGAGSFVSISDSRGNTYNTAVSTSTSPGGNHLQIWYASNIKAGTNTVTLNYGSSIYNDLYIAEFSGIATSNALDATSTNSGTTPGAAPSSGAKTISSFPEIIFGFGTSDSSAMDAGSMFASLIPYDGNIAEYRTVNTAGSYTATSSLGSGNGWAMAMATFRVAAEEPLVRLMAPSDAASNTHVATGTPITIKIGSNATYQQQGQHWITNPSTPGVYTISVGGTFGGSGNIPVSINAGQTVQATVAENLSLTVNGVAGPITFVQAQQNDANPGPVVTVNINTTAGNTVCVVTRNPGNSDTAVITDSASQSGWIQTSSGYSNYPSNLTAMFCRPNSAALTSVTVTWSNSSRVSAVVFEISGLATSSIEDASVNNNGGAATTATSNPLTTANANDILIFGAGIGNPFSNPSCGAGYTLPTNGFSQRIILCYKIVSGTQTGVTATSTWTTAQYNSNVFAALKGATNTPCTADDGATVTPIGTSPTSVPFGFINSNTFYQGCQDVAVSTNASAGYSLTVQESRAMQTSNGLYSIPDTTCDAGTCETGVAASWTNPQKYGLGHTCANIGGSDCNATYANGTKFRPIANVQVGTQIGFIQSNSASTTNASLNIPFASSVKKGDLIVVGFEVPDANTPSVSDTLGNSYTKDAIGAQGSSRGYIYRAVSSGTGSDTVQISDPGTFAIQATIHEYSGIDTSSPLDVTSVVSDGGPGSALNSGAATTHYANELVFGYGYLTNNIFTVTAGSMFTLRQTTPMVGTNQNSFSEDRIVNAIGTYSAAATISDSTDQWAMLMATYKGSGNSGQTLMSNTGPVASSTGRVKYRLSASPSQPAGTYTTVITYTLTPTY